MTDAEHSAPIGQERASPGINVEDIDFAMRPRLFLPFAVLLPWSLYAEPLTLSARSRSRETPAKPIESALNWEPKKTALIICDMWDTHTCPNAAARVAEMAPRVDAVAKALRAKGVFIIHCPSDTLKFYEGTPQRELAQTAPVVEPKVPLQRWCYLDKSKEPPLPIDDSDGGCDCPMTWKKGDPYPWKRQHAAIEIAESDAITENAEAYYLIRQRGIEHVLICGVHLNMCVLGRPFGIRQLRAQGLDVMLLRDLTDTMYNPAKSPFVSHVEGTELMVRHVETHWCPTTTSAEILGGAPFSFAEAKKAEPAR
jgi:nicotinamidase-related amidase